MKGKVNQSEQALGMNWTKLVELQDASNGDAQDFVDSVKEDIFQNASMFLLQQGRSRNCQKTLGRLILLMLFIRK